MEIKERNTIIGAISLIIGLILILFTLPMLTNPYTFSIYALLQYNTYLYLDMFALAITMLLHAYFLIKPTRTFKGKQNLAISAMVFGLVLVIIPTIGIGLGIYSYMTYSSFNFTYIFYALMSMMPLLVMLIPGVALLIHGQFLRKKPRTEEF